MKIYCLMENTPYQPEFAAEHGLSLYIETKNHKILFDTGQTGAFADNAKLLGIDLKDVDVAVLSHGHYDHGGGLKRFLELNSKAPIYVSRYAFGKYYHGEDHYIGLAPELEDQERLIYTGDDLKIDDELEICSCNDRERKYPTDSDNMTVREASGAHQDIFLHEQYLTICEDGKKVLISGCSHKGICNIMEWIQPDVLIGGFHFIGHDLASGSDPALDEAAEILNQYDTEYYTCHCTGSQQYEYLEERMEDNLHYLASGQILTI